MANSLNNKERAMDFLRLASSGQVRQAYQKYVGPGFRHHNPYFKGDAESLMTAMEENALKNPNKIFEIKRAFQEGDLVAVHSRVQQNPDDAGAAVVHIFKFNGNVISELWDVGQPVTMDSPNENGMF